MRMIELLAPAPHARHGGAALAVPALLALSALALGAAPWLMPAGYHWVEHTTSESAAQGVPGAWLTRLGFVGFGLAVLWESVALASVWARAAAWLHLSFGAFMIGTAAFSTRPWWPAAPFDPVEDLLHSFTATAMGFSFSLGVLARLFQRSAERIPGRTFDALAIVAATVIPLAMGVLPGLEGILQRAMFLVAYLWYGFETRRIPRPGRGGTP